MTRLLLAILILSAYYAAGGPARAADPADPTCVELSHAYHRARAVLSVQELSNMLQHGATGGNYNALDSSSTLLTLNATVRKMKAHGCPLPSDAAAILGGGLQCSSNGTCAPRR